MRLQQCPTGKLTVGEGDRKTTALFQFTHSFSIFASCEKVHELVLWRNFNQSALSVGGELNGLGVETSAVTLRNTKYVESNYFVLRPRLERRFGGLKGIQILGLRDRFQRCSCINTAYSPRRICVSSY